MNSPRHTTRGKLLARRLAGASSLLYAFFHFVPFGPHESYPLLDDSWIRALHVAFLEHWQFGRDIIFTFGPWGFLYRGYNPATHLISIIAWMVLSIVFWWAAWRTARFFFKREFVSWFWLIIFISAADPTISWVLLLLVVHFFAEDRSLTGPKFWLAVALGLLSLIKFITFVLAVMVILSIALDNILRQRRFPWILLVFVASIFCFWIAAGQHLSFFGLYVWYSWQITNGFTEAMMLTGSNEMRDIAYFGTGVVMVVTAAGYAVWLRHRFLGIIPLAGTCLILFTAFKYGFVRHDAHEIAAAKDLLLVSLAYVAVLWPVAEKKGWKIVAATLLPPVTICLLFVYDFENGISTGINLQRLSALAESATGKGHLREDYEKKLAQLRNQFPLPRIEGTVDVYPWNLDPVFAYGLSYHPRPVIQSYSAFTPELARLNADFLRGSNAPENIVIEGLTLNDRFPPFNYGLTIDNRFPSLDDGLSWPELLTRYNVRAVGVSFVLLKRSPQTRQFHLVPVEDISLDFGKQIVVPPATNGPIWVKIELRRTWWGAVVSTLYKPPALLLTLSMRGERQLFQGRLVPGMARSGFLLSPYVEDCPSFALLASTGLVNGLSDREIASLSIITADGSSAAAYYHNPAHLRFYRLEYPKQDLENVKGFQQLTQLEKVLRHAELLKGNPLPQMVSSPGGGTALEVPRNSAILVAAPKGAMYLRVGFGIRALAKTALQDTNETTFRVLVMKQTKQRLPLWSQRVGFTADKSGQERQEALIDLHNQNVSGIILETSSTKTNIESDQRCYWSEIDFK